MWALVTVLVCSALGVGCEAERPPDLDVIQHAYDRERAAGSSKHDKDLKVLEAKCEGKRSATGYLCQVTFMSIADPAQRLYYDIVSVASSADGWKLTSGLCKR